MDDRISLLDYTKDNYHSEFADIINLITDNVDKSELYSEFIKYSRTIDRIDDANKISKNAIVTEGKLAYCINRGANLEPRSIKKIYDLLDKGSEIEQVSKEIEIDDIPVTTYAKSIISYSLCFSLIDNIILKATKGKFVQKNIPDEVRLIVRKYSDNKDKIIKQLEKHYSDFLSDVTKDKTVSSWVKPVTIVTDTLQLMASNSRKPRKSKNKNNGDTKAIKAANKMNYKATDDSLGIKGATPESIIGAAGVVLFNSKYRRCELYFAKDNEKLSVAGSKITNFDPILSRGKTIRNPEETLPHWIRAGNRRRLEVLYKDINGKDWEVNGKLNKNTMIIKVVQS